MLSTVLQYRIPRSVTRQPAGRRPVHRLAGICLLVATATPIATAAEPLWVSTTPLEGNRQLLIVVDQQRKMLAVYHVDTTSGGVTLRSTRALGFDLQLEDFNATDPRPAALKTMLRLGDPTQPALPNPSSEGPVKVVPAPVSGR